MAKLQTRLRPKHQRPWPAHEFRDWDGLSNTVSPRTCSVCHENETVLVEHALRTKREPAKVLVSDLDNVMWRGVVAEDGSQVGYVAEKAVFLEVVEAVDLPAD